MFREKRIPNSFYYLLLVFLLIFLLGITGIFRPARRLIEKSLIIPFKQKVFDWKRSNGKIDGNCELTNQKEIDELKVKIASLEEENKSQKRLLSSPLPKNWQFLKVKVINYGNETITIDSGRTDGVKEGMAAIDGSTYLGLVSKVSENISEIKLPTFPDEKASAKVINKDNEILAKGLLSGKGMGQMKLEQILDSENAEKGNLVVTSVDGGDLFAGEIEEVIKQKDGVFKIATVKRLYVPEKLNTIFLVRGKL